MLETLTISPVAALEPTGEQRHPHAHRREEVGLHRDVDIGRGQRLHQLALADRRVVDEGVEIAEVVPRRLRDADRGVDMAEVGRPERGLGREARGTASTTSSSRSARRATMPTVAPFAASWGASAAPMPEEAPVTRILEPSSLTPVPPLCRGDRLGHRGEQVVRRDAHRRVGLVHSVRIPHRGDAGAQTSLIARSPRRRARHRRRRACRPARRACHRPSSRRRVGPPGRAQLRRDTACGPCGSRTRRARRCAPLRNGPRTRGAPGRPTRCAARSWPSAPRSTSVIGAWVELDPRGLDRAGQRVAELLVGHRLPGDLLGGAHVLAHVLDDLVRELAFGDPDDLEVEIQVRRLDVQEATDAEHTTEVPGRDAPELAVVDPAEIGRALERHRLEARSGPARRARSAAGGRSLRRGPPARPGRSAWAASARTSPRSRRRRTRCRRRRTGAGSPGCRAVRTPRGPGCCPRRRTSRR